MVGEVARRLAPSWWWLGRRTRRWSRRHSQIQFWGVIQSIYYGISLGSVLLLAAPGLAVTFGVMGVINMAHGEMVMLGAYTTFVDRAPSASSIASRTRLLTRTFLSALLASVHPQTLSFWNRWLNSDFRGRKAGGFG